MHKVSAAIIAFNEEKHIARTIASLQNTVDEIVVVINDNSTDKTEEICRLLGVKIFKHQFENYGKQKQFATAQTSHNLVLSIDADEAIDSVLQQEIIQLKTAQIADAYTLNIKNFYCGRWMRFGGINSTKRLRIFNKQCGNWNAADVHEKIEMKPAANIQHLEGSILHIAYESQSEHWQKLQRYAVLNGLQLAAKSTSGLLFKMLFSPVSKFITSYFLKLGFLEGKQGLQFALFMSIETWLKYKEALQFKQKNND
ncbi:MAG: glycosyltransferase family 2 protein [Chitinophagales bacterium]